jgi:hypothetical protein
MSNFTPLVTKEYDFDGDKVKVTFSRLLRKDMLNVMPAFAKLNAAGEGSRDHDDAVNDILNGLADSLPHCVKSFTGLNDSTGSPISIETVVGEMYFMRLCVLISMDVVKESGAPKGN